METKVSVILPTYNRAYALPMALTSLACQNYKDFEVIIVDDASTDNTEQVCRYYASKYNISLLYLRNDSNKGAAASRNQGIVRARGDFITFLDSDDTYYPDKIEKQVKALQDNPAADLCYCYYTITFDMINRKDRLLQCWPVDQKLYPEFLSPMEGRLVTPAVMLRKKAVQVAGGFATHMHICEDLDLWARVLRKSQEVLVPEALVCIHWRHETIKYFQAFLGRFQLYSRLEEADPAMDKDTLKLWYTNLLDLYTSQLRDPEPELLALFIKLRKSLNLPNEQMTLQIGRVLAEYSDSQENASFHITSQPDFNPLVSIVIPVYNGADYLREAIDSALAQSYPNIEVLVINDGSSDNGATENIATSYGHKIRYFSQPNGGVASALNLGIEEMLGEYFSWLSHDDIYFPDKISRQIDFLRNNDDKKVFLFGDYSFIDAFGEKMFDVYQNAALINLKPLYSIFGAMINGCTALIPRDVLQSVGGFHNYPNTQDYDLWFRLSRVLPICHLPGLVVYSRYHAGQGSRRSEAIKEADLLWVRLMRELTTEEIASMEDLRETFFAQMGKLFDCPERRRAYAFAWQHSSRAYYYRYLLSPRTIIKKIISALGLLPYARSFKMTAKSGRGKLAIISDWQHVRRGFYNN